MAKAPETMVLQNLQIDQKLKPSIPFLQFLKLPQSYQKRYTKIMQIIRMAPLRNAAGINNIMFVLCFVTSVVTNFEKLRKWNIWLIFQINI